MLWTHGMINRLVMLLDGLMIVSGVLIAPSTVPSPDFLAFFVYAGIYVVLYGWVMNLGGAFRVEHYLSVPRQIRQVTVGVVLASLAVSVIDRTFIAFDTTTFTSVATRAGIVWAAIVIGRVTLVRLGMHWVEKLALLRRKAVIVGSADEALRAAQQLRGADARS